MLNTFNKVICNICLDFIYIVSVISLVIWSFMIFDVIGFMFTGVFSRVI